MIAHRMKLLAGGLAALAVPVAVACAPTTPTPATSNATTASAPASSTTAPPTSAPPAGPSTTAPPSTPSTASTLVTTTAVAGKNLLTSGAPCDPSLVGQRTTTDSGEQLTCTLRAGASQPRWLSGQ